MLLVSPVHVSQVKTNGFFIWFKLQIVNVNLYRVFKGADRMCEPNVAHWMKSEQLKTNPSK